MKRRPITWSNRLAFETLEARRMLAFGVTAGVTPTGQSTYVIDSGADLKFSVIKDGNLSSTIHLGDISSIQYKDQEMLAPYSSTSRYSHYESGLSSQTDVSYQIGGNDEWILVTADDSSFGVVQYYAVRNGDNNLYMASDVSAGVQGRFLAYLDRSVFSNIEEPSDISGNVGTVEGSDVFFNADGTTYSKFYNDRRMIENQVHGVTGTAGTVDVGAWMFMGNREHGANGPFHTIIDFQTTGGAVEIYNVQFSSGHAAIEPIRYGLMGPYALQFNDGSAPTEPDYSWMSELRLQGWVPESARGSIHGIATGMTTGHETVIGLRNSTAQYWATADPVTGAYRIDDVQAGTYSMTMYDRELEVAERTVTIVAQSNLAVDVANTYYVPAATWRIGTWDGTPLEFLNADKIAIMHPSDVRMSPWVDTNFVIGTNTDAEWPMAQFKDVNNGQRITFELSPAQAAAAQTLRIGITLGMEGGRNRVTVNSGTANAWTSGIPSASIDPNSRSITRGTYRGINQLYTYNIPASALVAGTNTIDLPVVSGTTSTGFLSPGVVYDAIDLVPTANLTNSPRVQTISLTPSIDRVGIGSGVKFSASARDQFGDPITANFEFDTTFGTIDQQGQFSASTTPGLTIVTATSGGVSAEATIAVIGSTPIVVVPAAASPNSTSSATVSLSVLGDDDGDESNLTYTWSVLGTPPGSVGFSDNGTNAAKNTTMSFVANGTYHLRVVVADADGNSTTSDVTVSRNESLVHYKADQSSGAVLWDSAGGGNDANLVGAYGFSTGRSNSALDLSGGYAILPSSIVSTLNDFTISTWVNLASLDTWARIFDFGDDASNYMFLTPLANTGRPRFAIRTPSNGEEIVDSSTTIPIGVWTHVAVTLSGNTARIYIDGIERGSNTGMTLSPSSLCDTIANFIGKSQFPDPALSGSIDDFRIYARALDAGEIASLVNTALPLGPSTVVATTVNDDQIDLSWSAVAGSTGYAVHRATASGGPYQPIATTTALSYRDLGLSSAPSGTTYYYVVTANSAGGDGSRSAEASATVLPPLPSAPDNVVVQAAGSGRLNLTWDAVTDAASYSIQRSTDFGVSYTPIASGLTSTNYSDSGLTNDVAYHYIVRSVNVSGDAASVATVGVPTDLHARLRFDETVGNFAIDSSGNQWDATFIDGRPQWIAGKFENSVGLDGIDDYLDLPTGIVDGLADFTISTWIHQSSLSTWERIFDFGDGVTNTMFLTTQSNDSRPRFSIRTPDVDWQEIYSDVGMPVGKWSHVAVTWTGNMGILYIDGVEVGRNGSMTLNPSSLGATTRNYIGKSQFNDPYLNAQLDEFQIFDRALSAMELAAFSELDFGDAPGPLPTRIVDDGARHIAVGPRLGASRDAESDGTPSVIADGDGDDEDGVMFGLIQTDRVMAGVNIELQNAAGALVDAWLDFNRDGIWQSEEQILDNAVVQAGLQTLNYVLPAGVSSGATFARVRVSSGGGLEATGLAPDGEVEDYRVVIVDPPAIESVVVGDGTPGRSMVSSLTVTFDREVDDPVAAFSITNRDTGTGIDNLIVNSMVDDGKTVSVITFATGPSVVTRSNGLHSLEDGNYELKITAGEIHSVDGGTLSSDYRFGASAADAFFRFFGDSDGDGDIDGQDFGRFGLAFLKGIGDAGFNPALDYDGDGDVDGQDYGHFGRRLLRKLSS